MPSVEWRQLVRDYWLEAGFAVAVFTAVIVVRLIKLGSVPRIVTADEADNLQTAYHVTAGTGPGFFGFDWASSPIFSLYPLAWTIDVFGNTISDYRLFPVILSLLTIILFYLLARESMGAPAALAAMALLGTNLLFLHFSRTAWVNINAPLFAVGAAWAATRAIKTQRIGWWALTGVFVAFGFYGYLAGRTIFIAVALVAVLAVALRLAPWRSTAIGLVVAGVVSAALFAPMAKEMFEAGNFTGSRLQNVSVFNVPEEQPYEGDTSGWLIAGKNTIRNYKTFVLQNGSEVHRGLWGRYGPFGRAPLDTIAAYLFWGGLIVAALRWRRTFTWWPFFAPLFIAEVFSVGTPDLGRGIIFVPFYFLFIGVLFDELLRWLRGPIARSVAGLAVVGVVAFVATTNVHDYFDWQDQPTTQALRMPGIAGCEFDLWRSFAQEASALGPANLDPAKFDTARRELNCSPDTRAWLQLSAPVEAPPESAGPR